MFFQQIVLGRPDIHMQKAMKLDPYSIQQKKINSEWIKILNASAQTIKLSEENVGRKSHDIRFDSDSLDSKGTSNQRNVDKVDPVKIKTLHTAKDTVSRVNSNPRKGRKCLQIIFLKRNWYPKYI